MEKAALQGSAGNGRFRPGARCHPGNLSGHSGEVSSRREGSAGEPQLGGLCDVGPVGVCQPEEAPGAEPPPLPGLPAPGEGVRPLPCRLPHRLGSRVSRGRGGSLLAQGGDRCPRGWSRVLASEPPGQVLRPGGQKTCTGGIL